MFKRVLVPLDGSMLAESALEPALHLSQQADGVVYLMRVPVFVDSGAQTSPEYHRVWVDENDLPEYEDVTAYLREIRERIARPGVSVRTIVGEGEPSRAILNTSVTKNIDLILMASHARSGISRWLLGSVSGNVSRMAQSPVILVRKPTNFNHILVTLDGSELAERVIEPALWLASSFGSQITILGVVERNNSTKSLTDKGRLTGDGSYLEEVLTRCVPGDLDLEINTTVMRGSAAEKILSYSAENDVDMIAMSTHGRTGLSKLIFGSVTEKVMCNSGCAMLITRPPDQELS
jgi:nucleotide-binding universal stress UspA family protein